MKKNFIGIALIKANNLHKVFLAMKLTALLLLVACLQVSAHVEAQTITYTGKNVPLKKIFKEIRWQTGYEFLYNSTMLEENAKVDIEFDHTPLKAALDDIFRDQPFTCDIIGKTIVIRRKDKNSIVEAQSPVLTEIHGTVVDSATGNPLVGVTIKVEESTMGTTTDNKGNFTLEVPDNAVLMVSYLGYNSREVTVHAMKEIKIILSVATTGLSQLVVVGYGTQKAKDISGAITSISSESFNKGIVTNPIEQIQGKVAGLVITNPGGDPNSTPSIRLRGQASLTGGQTPLIVVDGVPLDDPSQIANIPPEDIASYDVLKDASATAIYGSRGANGVIIINTKKGVAEQTKVSYSGYIGINHIAREYDMLNAQQWRAGAKKVGTDDASIALYDKGGNTDWTKSFTRTAITNSHTLGISGGTDNFTYHGSVNYINQQGVVKNTGKDEVGLQFNADKKALKDKLDIQLGIINSQTSGKLTDYSLFTYLYSALPVYPTYNPDGSYFVFSDFEQANPVEHQIEQLNNEEDHMTIMYGTANYEIVPGLKLGATGSLSYFNTQQNWFQPTFPLENNTNNGYKYASNRNSKKGDIHIDYNHSWGENNFSATIVHEYNDFIYNYYEASGQQYLVELNQNNSLQSGNPQYNSITSYQEEYELSSFLGRVTYNFADKYYINASLRRDGSSKFGVNNRWGNFPSISAAWRVSGESFMQNISWVSDLKIKGGYGVTGNQDAIDAYRSQQLLGGTGRYYDAANSSYSLAYAPTQNSNPDLKWEEVHGLNLGINFSLINNRLSGDVNWFHDKTTNLLYNYTVPVPPFYVNTILANVGSLINKGLEIQLNANIIKKKTFTWSESGQITFVNTKITSLSGTYAGYQVSTNNIPGGQAVGRGLSSTAITYLKVGYSPYVFFLPHYLGINDQGQQLFSDGKGNKVTQGGLNTSMFRYIDPSPKFNYGLSTTITYKQWSLNFFLRGVYGQKIFNDTRLVLDNINRLPGNNVTKEALTNGITDAPVASDLWLESASYLRLDNFTLAYTFSKTDLFSNIQLYISGNNLFVITPYKGLDPEISVTDNDSYIDANYMSSGYYPKARSFSFGINVSFK